MRFFPLITAICCLWGQIVSAQTYNVGLKISAADNWETWGDYILGNDLKIGLESIGCSVLPAYMDNLYPEHAKNTDIDIYMHGFVPFNPKKNKTNVLYLYYPLETANMHKYKNIENTKEPYWYSLQTELWDYDLIAVASPTYQKEIEKLGIKTIFTPQFTNPQKFYYEYDENAAHDILFVGRPGYERISAKWAIESGFDVALYGEGWEGKAPKELIKGIYIDNKKLHKYYASAKIVLNDTRQDMKKYGFISNRIFDATASGAFVISDYMPEIEKFYGDSIPMFKTKEDLKKLLDYYLSHPEERLKKAKQAQQITLRDFTAQSVARRIMSALFEDEKNDTPQKLIIKSPWPKSATNIGDYWLGLDMEDGFRDAGFEVKNYYFNQKFYPDEFYRQADNLLYMQFKYNEVQKEDDSKNKIMYLYFPTEVPDIKKFKNTQDNFVYNTAAYLNDELQYFDMIATPAKNMLPKLLEKGHKAVFVPQFTNPQKFKAEYDENLSSNLLFVGSAWYERVSVTYALENGYDISVYGLNWEDKLPKKYFKGKYINNNELNKYYSSAKIVLSDHPDDLAEMGLVINRIYDTTACGAFVISEYSPFIEEIYGDAIPMYKNSQEFKKLVDFYLAHPEERTKKAQKAQEITLKNYTNTAVAKKLKKYFNQIGRDKNEK